MNREKLMKHGRIAIALALAGVVSAAVLLRGTSATTAITTPIPANTEAHGPVVDESRPPTTAIAQQDSTESPKTEVVLGIPVLKDRNCSVTRHYVDLGNGVVTDAYSCVPHDRAPGEYERYGDEELAVLAYSDAKAASTLGRRLVTADPKRSRELLIRAVALQPGNVEPVMWLASQAYSLRGDSSAARMAMANAYVITGTARALGSRADIDWIIEDLRGAGLSDDGLAALDRFVEEDLRTIRAIQRDVFGHSSIGEDLL
jgi:hypothetical protein